MFLLEAEQAGVGRYFDGGNVKASLVGDRRPSGSQDEGLTHICYDLPASTR